MRVNLIEFTWLGHITRSLETHASTKSFIELHVLLRERRDQIVIMQPCESEHRLTIKLGVV